MTPEILHALSGAKGLPMPQEDAQPVNAVAELIRKERRLRDMLQRIERREDAEALETVRQLTKTGKPFFGDTAAGKNTRTSKAVEWTHAECAMACQGLDDRYFMAMRYTYALDDSVFHSLSVRLWEWALEQRERERDWPKVVVTQKGEQVRFMRDLVDMWMLEVRVPHRFLRKPNAPDLRRVIMNVSEPMWRRRLSPIYESIAEEYVRWLSIAAAHMWRRLREDAA